MTKNLKAWRAAAELTQEQAAVLLGITMIKMQRLERGEVNPDIALLKRIAGLYGRDWRTIEDEHDENEPIDARSLTSFFLIVHPKSPAPASEKLRLQRIIEEANAGQLKKTSK